MCVYSRPQAVDTMAGTPRVGDDQGAEGLVSAEQDGSHQGGAKASRSERALALEQARSRIHKLVFFIRNHFTFKNLIKFINTI